MAYSYKHKNMTLLTLRHLFEAYLDAHQISNAIVYGPPEPEFSEANPHELLKAVHGVETSPIDDQHAHQAVLNADAVVIECGSKQEVIDFQPPDPPKFSFWANFHKYADGKWLDEEA